MATIKGIISFPAIFTPKTPKGSTEEKYGCSVLIAPGDPQIAVLQAEVNAAKANSFPSGYNGSDECFAPYDTKYAGKDYYDPRFTGWYVFSCSAKADDRPAVVDANRMPVVDPSKVYSGMVAYVSAGISGYTKGKGGIGGWLNGVMITDEEPTMGRLDGKPSVDQMFASAPGGSAPQAAAPVPPAPNAPQAPAEAALVMTAAANGVTLEAYLATPGWTEQMLLDQGLATRPVATAPAAPSAPTPPAPPVPPAPAAPAAPVTLTMTAAANGVTLEAYLATPGWTEQMLLDQGLATRPSFT